MRLEHTDQLEHAFGNSPSPITVNSKEKAQSQNLTCGKRKIIAHGDHFDVLYNCGTSFCPIGDKKKRERALSSPTLGILAEIHSDLLGDEYGHKAACVHDHGKFGDESVKLTPSTFTTAKSVPDFTFSNSHDDFPYSVPFSEAEKIQHGNHFDYFWNGDLWHETIKTLENGNQVTEYINHGTLRHCPAHEHCDTNKCEQKIKADQEADAGSEEILRDGVVWKCLETSGKQSFLLEHTEAIQDTLR
jgi:hypothetical protein